MKPMSIYLSGPIDAVPQRQAREWRELLGAICPAGVLLVSPAHAFFGANKATARELDYVERSLIHACDGMLANLMDGPSFGTVREIEFARSQGRPVAVAGQIDSLLVHDLFVKPNVEEAFDALLQAVRDDQDRPKGIVLSIPDFRDFMNEEDE